MHVSKQEDPKTFSCFCKKNKSSNIYVMTAGGIQETELNALNIVQPIMKKRSRSETVDGSVQGVSWRMCV